MGKAVRACIMLESLPSANWSFGPRFHNRRLATVPQEARTAYERILIMTISDLWIDHPHVSIIAKHHNLRSFLLA
jgi:hypothetical protein